MMYLYQLTIGYKIKFLKNKFLTEKNIWKDFNLQKSHAYFKCIAWKKEGDLHENLVKKGGGN